jgi:hypothetical protein
VSLDTGDLMLKTFSFQPESAMAQNINVRMPPFLPTVPLPVGMVGQGMMYMYSCSQCDFKTHVEAMFKQHVDSVHLGIPRYEIQR